MTDPNSLTLPMLDIDQSTDMYIAGSATVSVAGIFTATGTGSLSLGQVTGDSGNVNAAQVGTNAQALSLHLDTSVTIAGVTTSGTLDLDRITQGAKSWLGVDASAISLSLDLAPLSRLR